MSDPTIDWRKPCEHGRYESHIEWWGSLRGDECPGGSPVTTADLEGEKVWWCEVHDTTIYMPVETEWGCWLKGYADTLVCRLVERLLIPELETQ